MAGSTEHDKIAELAGIPSVISEKIDRFMNDMNPPEELKITIPIERYSCAVT